MAKAIPLLPMFSVVLSWSLCGARTWIIRVGASLGKLGSANEGEENEAESQGTPQKCWCLEQGSLVVGARVGLASCRGWAWLYLVVGIITTLRTTMNVSSEHL